MIYLVVLFEKIINYLSKNLFYSPVARALDPLRFISSVLLLSYVTY